MQTTFTPGSPPPGLPRIISYYQTQHHPDGTPISVLPLLTLSSDSAPITLTHLIIAAIHLNDNPNHITLNDHEPSDPRYITLWAEMRVMQAAGIKVMGMLGGAAKGSYAKLDVGRRSNDVAWFDRYYGPLADMLRERSLDGLDLDVEEEMTLEGVIYLIDRLRADFGPDFIITLAPVATALLDEKRNLSGFDYQALEVMRGKQIAWYNTQFYCGWGDCSTPMMYEMLLVVGWDPAKVVMGMLTTPENGNGFVALEKVEETLRGLRERHPRFGGVMGWEYFNGLPGGKERPWEWVRFMTRVLRGGFPAVEEDLSPSLSREGTRDGRVDFKDVDPDDGEGEEAVVPELFEYQSDTEW